MKILFLCADWGIPLYGDAGSSVHLREMGASFQELGHEVRYVVANGKGNNAQTAPVTTVDTNTFFPSFQKITSPAKHSNKKNLKPAPSSRPSKTTTPIIKNDDREKKLSWKARVYYHTLPVQLNLFEELIYYRYRFASAVNTAIQKWAPDFIYERYALNQTGGLAMAQRHNIPIILEVNAPLVQERIAKYNLPRIYQVVGRKNEQRLWRKVDKIFCVSQELSSIIAEQAPCRKSIHILPNGVNCKKFSPTKATGHLLRDKIQDETVLIGWLGSLSKGRGAEEFIHLMPKVLPQAPNAHAVIIGGGPLQNHYEQLSKDLGIANQITFTGPINHEQVPGYLAELDIAVASYPQQKYFYFSPMKIYEYMASGLPVIAGEMGQMKDIIENGKTGILLPTERNDLWSKKLLELISDPEQRKILGEAARQKMVDHCSWVSNAQKVIQSAEELLQKSL